MTINVEEIAEQALIDWGIGATGLVASQNRTMILRWFENFTPHEHPIIAHLVQRINVVTSYEMDAAIEDIVQELERILGADLKNACLLPMGMSIGDSGAQFVYSVHKRLSDGTDRLIFNGTLEQAAEQYETIILVDDIIGSGGQAIKNYNKSYKQLSTQFVYAPIFAFEDGLNNVEKDAGYDKIIPGRLLREHDRAFSDDSSIFVEPTLRSELMEICRSYGEKIYPPGPLGFEDAQALISFPHNCPNNTLPVIWGGRETEEMPKDMRWYPLRIRRKRLGKHETQRSKNPSLKRANLENRVVAFQSLPNDLRSAYSALSLLGPTIDLETVKIVCKLVSASPDPLQCLEISEKHGLLVKIDKNSWQPTYFPDRALLLLGEDEKSEIPAAVVTHLMGKLLATPNKYLVSSETDAEIAFQILSIFDAYGYFDRRKIRVSWSLKKFIETSGSYRLLVKHLINDGGSIKPDTENYYWNLFHLSRTEYFAGNVTSSLDRLNELYHKLAEKTLTDSPGSAKLNGIKTSTIRMICHILVDFGYPHVAVRILDRLISETDVSSLNHTIAMQNMLMFSWALARCNLIKEARQIWEEVLDNRYQGFLSSITRSVSDIYKAEALISEGKPREGSALLSHPIEFFRNNDLRAYAWALSVRSEAFLKAQVFKLATDDMVEIIDVISRLHITTGATVKLLEAGRSEKRCSDVHEKIDSYFRELGSFKEQLTSATDELLEGRLLEHILLEFNIELDDDFSFDLERYKLLTPKNHPALNSNFMRSFINVQRSSLADLENKIDDIFKRYLNEEDIIFSTPVFNNLIVEICKRNKILRKKYVDPYIDQIKSQYGGIRLFYARYFELIDELEIAQELLDLVPNKNSFTYLNVEANIAGKRDCNEGLKLNKLVLERIPEFFRQQRSRIYNNMALLIHKNRLTNLYKDAISYCEMSIENNRNLKFHYPKNMLLTLRLELSDVENTKRVLDVHKARFRAPIGALEAAARIVKKTAVRQLAQKYLGELRAERGV